MGKMGQKWAKNDIVCIFEKFYDLFFPRNNLKWKIILFIFQHKPLVWQDSGSHVMDQNALGKSDWYLKKEKRDKVDFRHIDKHQSVLTVDTVFWVGMARHDQSTQNNKFVKS